MEKQEYREGQRRRAEGGKKEKDGGKEDRGEGRGQGGGKRGARGRERRTRYGEEERGRRRRTEGEEKEGKETRQRRNSCCYLSANDLKRGRATDAAAARAALARRSWQSGRARPDGLGGSSSPCLGPWSSPHAPGPGPGGSSALRSVVPSLPPSPPGGQVGGPARQLPLQCLLFLSWGLMARGNPLGPRPKSTTCRLFRLPRSKAGTSAGPGLPRPGIHRVLRTRAAAAPMGPRTRSMRGSPARQTSSKGEERFQGARRLPRWHWPGHSGARF